MHTSLILSVVCSMASLSIVRGHGRLVDPPSRSSMWRFGFVNPPNYNDNELFCGGFERQVRNGGKCGVCGDPYDGERKNEAGGIYANGIITRHYRQGQTITVKVEMTANHMGYFEFRLCPHNNPSVPVTQGCLDENLLRHTDGSTRFNLASSQRGIYSVDLVLPADVNCSQCVFQWKYHTGNSWGCEGENGTHCCVGCGVQEEFYGCSDIGIGEQQTTQTSQQTTQNSQQTTTQSAQTTTPVKQTTPAKQTTTPVKQTTTPAKQTTTPVKQTTTSATTTTQATTVQATTTTAAAKTTSPTATTTTARMTTTTTTATTTKKPNPSTNKCRSVGPWTDYGFMREWCLMNCSLWYCPSNLCSPECRFVGRRRR